MHTTDRNVLQVLVNLLGSLAYKLTGKLPLLCVEDDDGNWTHCVPNVSAVSWLDDGAEWVCPLHAAKGSEAAETIVR